MTKKETLELVRQTTQSLHIHLVEHGRHFADTRLSRNQLRECLLHSVLTWCYDEAESLNIPHIAPSSLDTLELDQVKQEDLFDA